ncbi:MAG: insulinase family protein, partial [Thermodesulfobacteriota bacterium]|nr:insulinase family protein [Thermodesulfobacteriota bacterium]
MAVVHGFELTREQDIPEIKATARMFRHVATGAELLSLTSDDENKVFGITFRTPPRDDTGVAHILEHSVLCGSRKYPLKEPFVELLKGSLQTFLNAFTYPDKTCYPVASANLKDFYNLVDVYLDAVFHPLIREHVFKQEGWHYELENEDSPLSMKGVVFNEMKGSYSSPDSRLFECSQQSLFPDTTYGLDSGGDPEAIPNLTYEAFSDFHRRFYHPSNARVFFSGDDPEAERLRLVNEYLREFKPLSVDSEVALQKYFSKPIRVEKPFAAGAGAKAMFTVNWLLPQTLDRETVFACGLLEHILIGLPSSPLRRKLMESGLGEDLAGVGLETELRQMFFSTGLKGLDLGDVDKARALIFKVLEGLAENGPHPHMVEAAVNSMEFSLRENNTGRFPRGLSLMLRALTAWLYGGDPLAALAFTAPFKSLKKRLAENEPVFQELLKKHFLDNPHQATLVLIPDEDWSRIREEKERAGLLETRRGLSQDEIRQIMREAGELRRIQETPDPPEAVAAIPCLALSDLDPEEKPIPCDVLRLKDTEVLYHDLETNGIAYLDLGLDLRVLPQELFPLAPLFGRALLEMGTRTQGFSELTMRIARKTGGIEPVMFASNALAPAPPAVFLFLRAKAVAKNTGDMLDILRDVLLEADFDNKDRFRKILVEEKARLEHRMVPAGHMMVASRLRAGTGPAGWAAEHTGGISALFAMRGLIKEVDTNWSGVMAKLKEIRRLLVSRKRMVVNATMEQGDFTGFEPGLAGFLKSLPDVEIPEAAWDLSPLPAREGLTLPASVNYVGKGVNLFKAGYTFHGSTLAVTKYARTAWLWDRVRVRGGAYGAFCLFDRFSGECMF